MISIVECGEAGAAEPDVRSGRVLFEEIPDEGKACGMTGWRVHAWVLMGNHYHLFIETP